MTGVKTIYPVITFPKLASLPKEIIVDAAKEKLWEYLLKECPGLIKSTLFPGEAVVSICSRERRLETVWSAKESMISPMPTSSSRAQCKTFSCDQEMQLCDYQVLFSELSKEERPSLQVMRMLNDILGIESSFAASPTEINRDEFNKAVEIELVYSSINLPKRPIMVNLIYTNWTGKAKLEKSKVR